MSSLRPRETFELLDGLRGVCAICVVVMHITDQYGLIYSIPHAYMAVPFFFMLSGIVISHAYEKTVMIDKSAVKFIKIRVYRLYPLLIMGLILSVFFNFIDNKWRIDVGIFPMILGSLLLIPYPGQSLFPMLPPQWSLAIELWGNLLHRLIIKILGRREILSIIACSGVVMSLYSIHFGGLNIGWSLQNAMGGIAIFAFCYPFGIFLYRVRDGGRLWKFNAPVPLLLFTLLAAICVPTPLRTFENGVRDIICVFILFPFILAGAINKKVNGLHGVINKWLGRISYPIYITHYPLVIFLTSIVNRSHAHKITQYFSVILIVLSAIMVSEICLLIERGIRDRLGGSGAVAQPLGAA